MSLITPDVGKQIKQALARMDAPIKILVFTQGENGSMECEYCDDTRQLIEELSALEDKISVDLVDLEKEPEIAAQYQINKIPALVFLRQEEESIDYGIRYYGIPAGYEFGSLIEDILMISQGNHGLSDRTLQMVQQLDRPVHIQVYVTPT